jgi:molybdopterin-guanine dinucleotide biosynthesis protein A
MSGEEAFHPEPGTSMVVLAGGQSRRLGRDKAFLMLDGQPLVVHTIDRLAALSDDLLVVTNEAARFQLLGLPVRLVPDVRPGEGALMGIYSGLRAARHPHALAVACDMPLLSLPLLRYMLPLADGYDVVIPRVAGWLEPLHAIYGKTCLSAMRRLLDQGQRQIIAFFDQVRVCYVEEDEVTRCDPRHLSFVNVNTPEDWQRVQRLLAESEQPRPG